MGLCLYSFRLLHFKPISPKAFERENSSQLMLKLSSNEEMNDRLWRLERSQVSEEIIEVIEELI